MGDGRLDQKEAYTGSGLRGLCVYLEKSGYIEWRIDSARGLPRWPWHKLCLSRTLKQSRLYCVKVWIGYDACESTNATNARLG